MLLIHATKQIGGKNGTEVKKLIPFIKPQLEKDELSHRIGETEGQHSARLQILFSAIEDELDEYGAGDENTSYYVKIKDRDGEEILVDSDKTGKYQLANGSTSQSTAFPLVTSGVERVLNSNGIDLAIRQALNDGATGKKAARQIVHNWAVLQLSDPEFLKSYQALLQKSGTMDKLADALAPACYAATKNEDVKILLES